MSLRYALMALLDATPMTGYTLAKRFDQSAAFVWHAPHSQIYPELRRLEESGFIVGREEARGAHGTRRRYELTEEGRAELRQWVGQLTPLPRERDSAYLKATYFEFGSYANARRQFQAHLAHHEQQQRQWETHVAQLENRDTDLLRLRLAEWPVEAHDAIVAYKTHVYRGLITRARHEAEWARAGVDLVDRLEAAAPAEQVPASKAAEA
jgi:DNA-binding PadR family transcriptional regulator